METELDLSKQTTQLYYCQYPSKAEMCRRLNRPCPWLDCWLGRYDLDDLEEGDL